jgi:hypothetical protein
MAHFGLVFPVLAQSLKTTMGPPKLETYGILLAAIG